MKVIVRERAEKNLYRIVKYIAEKGYPETALVFLERMREFTLSLGNFPEKYSVCKQPSYNKRNFRCAVFEENYIFIHKQVGRNVVLYNVVHVSRIR